MTEFEFFQAALEIDDPAARQQFLRTSCAHDAALLSRVEALLASHESQSLFLHVPVVEQLSNIADPSQTVTATAGSHSTKDNEFDATFVQAPSAGTPMNPTEDSDDEISVGYLEPSSRPDSLGRLGHYEVLEVVGRGAFGIVLRAFDEKLQRVVAIKVMAPELATMSPARKRFLREAQASAAIRHEHVVNIHAVEEKPLPYLVMEFIPGQTLQQRLEEHGPLDVMSVLRLGRQIAAGLAAAHAINLIHRDIKPGNILLETGIQERVKITDFGLARSADDASLTQSGTIAGTPMYMAPEQALGRALDQRADLFSLGSVLYQMVSGRPPFRASSALAVLQRVTTEMPRPITEIIPETPDWLCSIIAKLHAKNPDERYQSAQEVVDVLTDCESQLQANAKLQDFSRIPQAQPVAVAKDKTIGKRIAAVAAMGVLVLLGAVVIALVNRGGTPTTLDVPDLENATMHVASTDALAQETLSLPATTASLSPQSNDDPRFPNAEVRRIAALPANEQIEEVRKELVQRNPGYNGELKYEIVSGVVTELYVHSPEITDIAPLRALPGLKTLDLSNEYRREGKLSDLSPLQGLPIISLNLNYNNVSDLTPLKGMQLQFLHVYVCTNLKDLSPLRGMPLQSLQIGRTAVTDLSPLQGAPLQDLSLWVTPVSDLRPLEGMPLQSLNIDHTKVSDLTPLVKTPLDIIFITPANFPQGLETLRRIKSLHTIGTSNETYPASEFWKRYDDAEFGHFPWTKNDIVRIGFLDPETQIVEVREELKRRNPNFNGVIWNKIEDNAVTELRIVTDNIADISPIAVFTSLQKLDLSGTHTHFRGNSQLADLSRLKGMKLAGLQSLNLCYTRVDDAQMALFADCKGLTELKLGETMVGDAGLVHFKDCKNLAVLNLDQLRITDAGVANFEGVTKLVYLNLNKTQVTPVGLASFAGCKDLQILHLGIKGLPDAGLVPFQQCKRLTILSLRETQVTDAGVAPFGDCPNLNHLNVGYSKVTDEGLARFAKCDMRELYVPNTKISDAGLSHFKDKPNLTRVAIQKSRITDLTLLKALPLREVQCSFASHSDAENLRSIATLQRINDLPAEEFWKLYDEGVLRQ